MKNIVNKNNNVGEVYLNQNLTIALSRIEHREQMIIWRLSDGQVLGNLRKVPADQFTFFPNENKLLYEARRRKLCIFNWTTQKIELFYAYPHINEYITWLDFSPDGKYCGASFGDGCLTVWNMEWKQIVFSFRHHSLMNIFAFSHIANEIICHSFDNVLTVWSIEKNPKVIYNRDLGEEKDFLNEFGESPEITPFRNEYVVVGSTGIVESFDSTTHQSLKRHQLEQRIWSIGFAPSRRHFATGNRTPFQSSVNVYDYHTACIVRKFKVFYHKTTVMSCFKIWWVTENVIYARMSDFSLVTLQMVDFEFFSQTALVLLAKKIAPYVVVNLINLLLADEYKTSLACEENVLEFEKAQRVQMLIDLFKHSTSRARRRQRRLNK